MYEVFRAALDCEHINIRLGSECGRLADTAHWGLKVRDRRMEKRDVEDMNQDIVWLVFLYFLLLKPFDEFRLDGCTEQHYVLE